MPLSNGNIMIEDFNGETSTVNINLQDMDALGTAYGTITQDMDEIKDGVIALIRGVVRDTGVSFKYLESGDDVDDVEAAREGKWLVTYIDNTPFLFTGNTSPNPGYGRRFSFEIPTANRTLLPLNKDELDLADPDIAAAVALIEPNIRSPYNRSASGGIVPVNVIVSIKYVGRNV